MDIRNRLPNRFGNDAVYQPYDRRVIRAIKQVFRAGQHIRQQVAIARPD
jgi:hypothetical protein